MGEYEKVITTYHVSRLDLEEDSLNNYAGIDRRNKAIAMVERGAQRTHRSVQFVYTIPTDTTGTDQGGSYVLQNALANRAQIAIVNIMTFDYYDNLPHELADNTEGAAQQLYDRLHGLYPGKTPSQLWGMIGVTEDLGVDDFGPAETFTLADARTVERWAAARGLAELSFWNVQDDNTAGSQQKQSPYEYSRILEPFTSSAPTQRTALDAPSAAAGAVDPVRGNMRSVSCPSPSFCMAVDESGNNALRWDGTGWSAPVSIDPGMVGPVLVGREPGRSRWRRPHRRLLLRRRLRRGGFRRQRGGLLPASARWHSAWRSRPKAPERPPGVSTKVIPNEFVVPATAQSSFRSGPVLLGLGALALRGRIKR